MALCPVWCGTYPLAGSDKFWQSIQAVSSPESARAKSTSHSAFVPEWRVVTSLTSGDHPGSQPSPEVPPDFRETHIHGLHGPSCGGRARRIPSCKDRAWRMSFPEGRPRRALLFGGRRQVRLHPLMGSVPSPSLLSPPGHRLFCWALIASCHLFISLIDLNGPCWDIHKPYPQHHQRVEMWGPMPPPPTHREREVEFLLKINIQIKNYCWPSQQRKTWIFSSHVKPTSGSLVIVCELNYRNILIEYKKGRAWSSNYSSEMRFEASTKKIPPSEKRNNLRAQSNV